MPTELNMVKDVLNDIIARLHREEERDEPEIRNVLFSLSLLATASVNMATTISNVYAKILSVEKDHDTRLHELSKKVIYLSAAVSIGGAVITFVGKYLIGLI